MASEAEQPKSQLDAFLAMLAKDVASDSVKPLEDYLARFPGDDARLAQGYSDMVERLETISFAPAGLGSSFLTVNEPGKVVGPYRILQELGRGGQGIVFLAEDTRLRRRVALKVLTGTLASSPQMFARFRREAEAASRVDHPGICAVYDTGEHAGIHYIAMRYVEGQTLARLIATAREHGANAAPSASGAERERLMRAAALVEEVARALQAAHDAGIVHRDIKPGNIMVSKSGQPVILDFGMARDLESDLPTMTQSGEFFGTPLYMSPEQLLDTRVALDARTDVYSLGVTLFECVTLRRPFEHSTRETLVHAIRYEEADPRRLNPAVPRDLAIVIQTALEKDRKRRYPSALELADELRRVRTDEPIRARPAGWPVKLRRFVKRQPTLTMAAVLVAALLGGLWISRAAFAPKRGTLRLTAAPEDVGVEIVAASKEGPRALWVTVPGALDLDLDAGIWILTATKQNHRPSPPRTVRIEPDRTSSVHLSLEPVGLVARFDLGPGSVAGVAVADFDEDGRLDLAVAHALPNRNWEMEAVSSARRQRIWSNTGPGTLQALENIEVDDDGIGDVVAIAKSPAGPELVVLSGRDGCALWRRRLSEEDWQRLAIADLDADGKDDIVAATGRGEIVAFSPRRDGAVWPALAGARKPGNALLGLVVASEAGARRILVANRREPESAGARFSFVEASTGRETAAFETDALVYRVGPSCTEGVWFGTLDGRLGLVSENGVRLFGAPGDDPIVRIVPTGPEDDPARTVTAVFRSGVLGTLSLGEDTMRTRRFLDPLRRVEMENAIVCNIADTARSRAGGTLVLASGLVGGDGFQGGRIEMVPLSGGPTQTYELPSIPPTHLVTADFDNDGTTEPLVVMAGGTKSSNRPSAIALECKSAGFTWRVATAGSVWSSPEVVDLDGDSRPEVVVGSNDGRVYVLSGADGRVLWSQATKARVEANPAIADLDGDGVKDVVVGSNDSRLYAFGGADGHLLWPPYATGTEIFARAVIEDFDLDGKPDVACASVDGLVHFVRGSDGSRLRPPSRLENNGRFRSSPLAICLDDDSVPDLVLGTMDGRLCAFSGATGDPLWNVPIAPADAKPRQREVRSSPAMADLDGDSRPDFVVGGADGSVWATRGSDRSILWKRLTNALRVDSSPALADLDGDGIEDVVVGGEEDQESGGNGPPGCGCCVNAISGKTGQFLWTYRTGGGTWSSPALVDVDGDGTRDVVIGSADEHLYVLSGRDGALIHRYPVGGRVYSSPAIADLDGDGVPEAVFGCHDNQIYAISLFADRLAKRREAPRLLRAREDLAAAAYDAVFRRRCEPKEPRELHLVRARALVGSGRLVEAACEIEIAADGGLRTGELGALEILSKLEKKEPIDTDLVSCCVLVDPIGFLTFLATPSQARDGADPAAVRAVVAETLELRRDPKHRNAALADLVMRLLLDQPFPATSPSECGLVRTDYVQALRSLADLAAGKPDAQLVRGRTEAGRRFCDRWTPDRASVRKALRLP